MQLFCSFQGPVSVSVSPSSGWFSYSGGILTEACTGQDSIAALVVGYGTDSQGQDYWLLKHSGGVKWGEEGYVRNSLK